MLGTLGHSDPGERAALLAERASRLPVGGLVLLDLQAPHHPQRVEPFEFTAAVVGQLTYRCIREGLPVPGELMRWRMSYLVMEGERVLEETPPSTSTSTRIHETSPMRPGRRAC